MAGRQNIGYEYPRLHSPPPPILRSRRKVDWFFLGFWSGYVALLCIATWWLL